MRNKIAGRRSDLCAQALRARGVRAAAARRRVLRVHASPPPARATAAQLNAARSSPPRADPVYTPDCS